jgi:uncharacterized protein YodC (DUF2158 family)
MIDFKEGDSVRHKYGKYNHGLGMEVTGIIDNKVRCEWFEGPESIHKQEFFDKDDLVLVRETDGGFRNAGE